GADPEIVLAIDCNPIGSIDSGDKNRSRPRRAICVHWNLDELMGCGVRNEQNIAGIVKLNAICAEGRRETRARLQQRVITPNCRRAATGPSCPDNTVEG